MLYSHNMSKNIHILAKADMHVHLEGTLRPEMMKRLAARNGVAIPSGLLDAEGDHFRWDSTGSARDSLISFVNAYDEAASVIKTAQDFTDITYDYLARAAGEGCIYSEITISADHGHAAGLSYPEMIAAIEAGCDQAKQETGIEARLISTFVRHYGATKCLNVGRETAAHPHRLVTALGIAGDENAGSFADFAPAFKAAGLKNRTIHAGEAAGYESVLDAIKTLSPQRIGHGVRLIESTAAMQQVKDANITLEVCVASNLAMRVFNDTAAHPLRRLYDFGLKITLGSDDPAFFGTSIGQEYTTAHEKFGFTLQELHGITRTAIDSAFVDDATRRRLHARLGA